MSVGIALRKECRPARCPLSAVLRRLPALASIPIYQQNQCVLLSQPVRASGKVCSVLAGFLRSYGCVRDFQAFTPPCIVYTPF